MSNYLLFFFLKILFARIIYFISYGNNKMISMVDLIFFKFKKINDLIKVNKSILLSSFQYNDTKNGLIQQINLNIKWLELNIEKIIKLV